jgi:hypothetical protein
MACFLPAATTGFQKASKWAGLSNDIVTTRRGNNKNQSETRGMKIVQEWRLMGVADTSEKTEPVIHNDGVVVRIPLAAPFVYF